MELRRNAKRFISALLALVMVLSWVPGSALTAQAAETGLCDHHTEHTAQCGYRAAAEGAPCKYDGLCDKGCADSDGDGQTDHARDCAYTQELEKDLCDQGCQDTDGDSFADHTESCAFTQAKGRHEHGETCGYAEAYAGSPCTFQCEQCAALTATETAPETTAEATVPETTEATIPETTEAAVPETTEATVPETTEATVPEETLSPVQQLQELIDALPEHITEDNREAVTAQLQEILSRCAALTEAEQEQIDITPCLLLQEELDGANAAMPLEGSTYNISGNCTGDHTGWTAWTSDLELPTAPGNYYLTKDVSVWIGEGQKWWGVPAGEITICLNGHYIMNTPTPSSGDVYLISVGYGATLNLCDCQGGGYVERPNSSCGAICVLPDGVFNMYGGSIRNSGIGVYIDRERASTYGCANSGRFNMYGGTISGCGTASVYVNSLLRPNGGFYMYGGTLSSQVYIINLTGKYNSNNFNTLHYFGGTINSNPQVFLTNNKSIYVGAKLSAPLRIKVNEEAGFVVPDGKLIVAEPGYTLTDADAFQVRCPGGTRIPVVDTASNSIVLKEVEFLGDGLSLEPVNYGQKANEAVIHGRATIDGTTELAGRLRIADETVYNAGTHEIEVKFQAENRSEELSYTAVLTVNKVAPNLAWADDKLNQTVAKPRVKDEFTAPTTNSNGKVSYAYRAADAADTEAWTDGLPKECGTYVVKAKQEEGTNHTAAESSNTVTLSVADVPGTPTVHAATLSDAQAEITWDAPDYVGSSPITGWEVTWLRKGRDVKKTETLPADARSATFTLTDKSENDWYQCEVKAINAAGAGEAGFRSPIYVSMKPVITRISVIRFNRKDYVEGEKLDTQEVKVLLEYNYKSESNPLSGYVSLEQAVAMGAKLILDGMDSPPKEIDYKEYFLTLADNRSDLYLDMPTDLPEQTIRYKVGAINVGTAYPGAPQNLKVTPGDRKLTVTWEEPAITYGKETTGYIIQCADKNGTEVYSQEVSAATHQVVLGSLTNEETYTIHIRARNKDGYGETATIEGKPSPYATIRLTPKAQIVFGENVGDWIGKLDETYNYTIDNNTDLDSLTGLAVEFESEATQLADGDKLQVTFKTKAVGDLTYDYAPRVDITPTVKVIGPDGTEKTNHNYTFITPTAELEYLPRDISKDTCGIEYFELTNNQYDGSSKITAGTILLTLNGSNAYPNGKTIRRQDYTCEILDQNGNPVEEIYLPGTYTVIMTGTGSCTGEYRTTLTIRKRDTIVKAKNQTVEYGTAISSDAAMANLTSRGWQDIIKVITLTPESDQVGTWKITPSDAHIWNTDANEERTDCYNITGYQSGTLTITKAENPTIAFKETSITREYNNGDPIPNPTEDMLIFTGAYYEDILFQWQDEHGNVLDSAPTGTGSYKIKAYLVDDANHGAAEAMAAVTVDGKRINEANMTLAEGPFVYNGTAHTPTVTVKDGETVIDASKYTVTYANNTDAGTATVTVADDDNTDIYEISATLTFTIAPCPLGGLTASLNNPGSIVYDGTEQTPGVTVTGPNGTALTADTDYTVTYTDNLNAGTADATITAADGGNYTGTKTLTFTIAQKTVTPVLSGTAEKVYDGSETVPAGLTVTLQGVLDADADKLTVSAAAMTYNSANVADADTITATGISLSGAASGNYVLSADEISIPGTITKKAPAINFTDQTITYGDTPTAATADSDGAFTYSYENQGNAGDTAGGWPVNVGTYTVTATVAETDNYLSGSASITLTVNRKPIQVPEAVPGLIYNGQTQTGVEAGTGYTLTNHTAKNAGTYHATAKVDGNHIWQLAGGLSESDQAITWNIKQKDITVVITANGGTYNGQPFLAEAELVEVEAGDDVPVTLTYTDGASYNSTNAPVNAGDYTVTASISDANYKLTGDVAKGFTIEQADPGLQAVTPVEKTYGDADFKLNVSKTGDGALTYTSGNPDVVTVDENGNVHILKAGSAEITAAYAETGNHTAGSITVTVNVQPKTLTPGISITEKVYDGTTNAPDGWAIKLDGVVGNDDVSATAASCTYDDSNAGDRTLTATGITLTGTASGNYVLSATEITTNGTITKKAPTINFTDRAITYGDAPTEATADSNGTFSYSYENQGNAADTGNGWPVNVGTYTVTATAAETDNYLSGSASITLTVNRKPIQVPEAVPGLIYNGQTQTGVEDGTGYTLTKHTAKNAGTYHATAKVDGNHIWQLAGGLSEADQTIAWSIAQKEITVDITANGGIYNGQPFPASAKLEDVVENETVAVILTYTKESETTGSATAPTNVGNYTVTATITNSNYALTGLNSKDFTITPASIEGAKVTVDGSYTYTGAAHTPAPTVTLGNETLTRDTDYTVTYAGNTDAGSAEVTVIGTGNYTGEATGEFTIGKAVITDVSATVDSVEAPAAQDTVQSAVTNGSSYTGTITWTPEASNYGFYTAYTATLTLTPDENHTFGELSPNGWKVTVGKDGIAALTRTFRATRKEKVTSLGTIESMTLEEHSETAAGVIAGLPAAVTATTETGTASLPISWSCEEYSTAPNAINTFTWTVADVGSYDASGVTLSGSITVTNPGALPVTHTGTDKEVTYHGSTIDVSELFELDKNAGAASYRITGSTGEGMLNGSVLTVTKAGTFTITVQTAAEGIYAGGTAEATLTVNKGTGTGSVTIEGWTYGETATAPVSESETNGSSDVTYTYSLGGTTIAKPTKAGTYTVTATFGETDLYNECTASADFTIAPKPITVTITPNGGVYGGEITGAAAVLNDVEPGDTAPTVTLTYTGKANDGTEVNSETHPTLAGTYTVTASIPESNYILTGETSAQFRVRRAESLLKAEPVEGSKTYGDEDFTLTVTQEGTGAVTYASDSESVVTVDETGKVHIVGAGTAKITVTVAVTDNYTPAAVEITLSVAKKPVKVTVDSKTKIYGEPDPELTYTVEKDALVGTDTLKIELTVSGKDVGTYDIAAPNAAKDNPNYEITFEKGKLTIDPRTIDDAEIILGPALTANGKPQTQTVKSVTVKNSKGEVLNVTYDVIGNTAVNAGGYEMTITGIGNFTGTKKQSFAIAPGAGQPVETDDSGNPVLGEGKITEQVIPGEGAPAVDMGTSKEKIIEILTQSGCLTAQELAQVADGADLKIIFTTSGSVSDNDRTQIKSLANGYTIGSWFDISLYKQLDEGDIVWLHETGTPIRLTVRIPKNLINTDNNVTRTFWIIRCHDGNAEFLSAQYDDSRKTLSFDTDRFSGYAIVYKDTKNTDSKNPQTGDSSRVDLWLVMMAVSALGLGIVLNANRKKKRTY